MKTAARTSAVSKASMTPQEQLANHEGLRQARLKLAEIQGEQARIESRIQEHRLASANKDAMADKILSGQSIEADTFNLDAAKSQLAAYQTAIVKQNSIVEQELRLASKEICDQVADAHKQQAAEFVEHAKAFIATFKAMESRVLSLRHSGVQLDNRFPLYESVRLQTMFHGMKTIIALYDEFSR